jgi:pimeloyl-ACP methyl ester carboxylesterase
VCRSSKRVIGTAAKAEEPLSSLHMVAVAQLPSGWNRCRFFALRHDVPCYAVSYRGHGASWYPFFLRMYFTTKRSAADDLVAAIKFVRQKEGREVVLVGHSSGGALASLS